MSGDRRGGDRLRARQPRQRVLGPLVEGQRLRVRVAVERRRHAEGDQAIGGQSQIDAAHVVEALGEEPGRGQQGHRQGDLAGRQPGAEARRGPGARRLSRMALEHADEIGPRAVQRRIQAEDDAGGQRQRQRVEQHAAVDRRGNRRRRLGRQQRRDAAQRPARHQQPGERRRAARACTIRPAAGPAPASGWRRSRGGPPSRRCARRPAPAADWRCWRRP